MFPDGATSLRTHMLCCLTLLLLPVLLTAGIAASDAEPDGPGSLSQSDNAGPDPEVLELALKAATAAQSKGLGPKPILTVIDYSLPSDYRRLWVLDLQTREVLYHELVAHGKGSGVRKANSFSNRPGSRASSLGLFEASETYNGKHGYSLKLRGLEKRFNDNAASRAIVIHGAWYVSDSFAKKHGRVGRSWGCPALDLAVTRKLIDTIKDGSLIFAYYPDNEWLEQSTFLE